MPAMKDSDVLARLSELGLELPPTPTPVAAYVPVVISGSLAMVAGQVPMRDGRVIHPGHLGGDVSIEDGVDSAAVAVVQALSALRAALGSFDRLRRIVQVTVFVAATSDFVQHPQVANGASERLIDILGDAGKHARAAVGMSSLPLGSCVEVQVTAEVDPGPV
jgi:enamine deaminase RidA (YjgF/YER057c/UK114 family)